MVLTDPFVLAAALHALRETWRQPFTAPALAGTGMNPPAYARTKGKSETKLRYGVTQGASSDSE